MSKISITARSLTTFFPFVWHEYISDLHTLPGKRSRVHGTWESRMNYGCRSEPTRTFVTFTHTVLGFDRILSFILKRSFRIDLRLFRLFLNIVGRGRPNARDVSCFLVRVTLGKVANFYTVYFIHQQLFFAVILWCHTSRFTRHVCILFKSNTSCSLGRNGQEQT